MGLEITLTLTAFPRSISFFSVLRLLSGLNDGVIEHRNRKIQTKNMQVINKTPHAVHIVGENNEIVHTYPKADSLIRLTVRTVAAEPLSDGTPTSITEFGYPEGLPEYQEDIYYIVSQLVKNACPERADLLVPAEVVRDSDGNIIGCKSLGR